MAASPEASIFLAELATNMLHTLESEEKRRQNTQQEEPTVREETQEQELIDRELGREMQTNREMDEKHPYSPTSSMADTRWSFDTESMPSSSAPGTPMTGMYTPRASVDGPMLSSSPIRPGQRRRVSISSPAEKHSGYRSARIEKEVLLKMGVDPSMLSEIQRVLDVIAADEEEKECAEMQRRREEAEYVASLVVPEDQAAGIADVGIAHAFGNDDEEKTDEVIIDEDASSPTPVMLPEWHEEPLREALRRRHAYAAAVTEQRDAAERQAREMAAVLAQRHIKHGELQPADVAACQIIARMLVYGVALFLLLSGYLLTRNLFN
ncbi:hypothetical protein, variant [Phytophthora nicotianae CJ01A1]|nr:hypothetical protein, variant [Phytophthora nicotianae P1569]ETK77003.1 hypothetical protein, variant [Phytophthora nicotianae]ETO65514.1 hypothetical protein, variant [Phytophthora nicotianae P1976]ETP06617.1 hypothetical protein, variant [Phytophthora nicotianae CJ01A1]ETL30446.1 hypothetical protein, variant [Phytophthora nicotianae]